MAMVATAIVVTVVIPVAAIVSVTVIVPVAIVITVTVVITVVTLVVTIHVTMVDRRTGRAVAYPVIMMVAVVSTVPTVTHSKMMGVVMVDVVVTTAVIPTMSSYTVPGMTSTIAGVEYGATIVEIVTMWITGIDAEVPETI